MLAVDPYVPQSPVFSHPPNVYPHLLTDIACVSPPYFDTLMSPEPPFASTTNIFEYFSQLAFSLHSVLSPLGNVYVVLAFCSNVPHVPEASQEPNL